jgi:hypothetical protein
MGDGGVGVGLTTIGESAITTLTDRTPLRAGTAESVAVINTGKVPALAGVPDSCPVVLNDRPGGSTPVSDQLKGAVPPLATVNV